jgi:hypothetical protein
MEYSNCRAQIGRALFTEVHLSSLKLPRLIALSSAAAVTLLVAVTILGRLAYPYDLEWAEGSMLCHVLRLVEHEPLYAPPSLELIAHPYTPLYMMIVALAARIFGLSYLLARLVSLASFAGALAIGWRFLRSEGAPRSVAASALGIVVAAYSPTGAWYDLARVDSMLLFFAAAGVTLAWTHRRSPLAVAAAALLLLAACATKQTALPFVVAVAVALAFAAPRSLGSFVATVALGGGLAIAWAQHASDGWFWFYVVRMKSSHGINVRALLGAPGKIAVLVVPAIALVGWAMLATRRRSPALVYATFIALVALALSAAARATPYGYVNAYIPAVYFVSLAAGVAATRLLDRHEAATHALLAAAILLAPGVIPWLGDRLGGGHEHVRLGYDVRRLLPAGADRARADALIARIRATDGDVLIPAHPYYAHLAGKRVFTSQMGLTDLTSTRLPVLGLDEALARGRFAAVILDEPFAADAPSLARLVRAYPRCERIDGPCVISGDKCVTQWCTRP